MTTMTVDVEDLGTLLRLWRVSADLSLGDVAERATEVLPASMSISRELVRRYERNIFPAGGPEPWVIAAVTIGLGHRLGELPEETLTDALALGDLLRKSCFPLSAPVAA